MLHWIREKCTYGWKPGAINTVILAGVVYEVPMLNRTEKPWKLWDTYAAEHSNRIHSKNKSAHAAEQVHPLEEAPAFEEAQASEDIQHEDDDRYT